MARFDVYPGPDAAMLWLDCQSDLLAGLNTRFVVPLRPLADVPLPARRLNPVFEIGGQRWVMQTQFAAAVRRKDCGPPVASLAHEDGAIINALDMLISGY